MQDIYTSTFHYSKGMWGHVVDCYVSVFCQYLLPIADILPGRCPCQEEVYTQGGSCPGWPYLEQQDKYHNKMWNKTKPRKQTHCKNLQRNHQIPFSAQLVILEVNMNVQLYSLFQEAHFAWQLLPLFVLIDKKLRQFLRAQTSNTSSRPNREGRVFFFPFKWWLICCFPTHVIIPFYHLWIHRLGCNESVHIQPIYYALPFQAGQQECCSLWKIIKTKAILPKKEMGCLSATVLCLLLYR